MDDSWPREGKGSRVTSPEEGSMRRCLQLLSLHGCATMNKVRSNLGVSDRLAASRKRPCQSSSRVGASAGTGLGTLGGTETLGFLPIKCLGLCSVQ